MERLGDKLKRIEAAAATQQDQRAARYRAAADEVERRRKQAVREQFETWKQDIISAIDQGKAPPSARLDSMRLAPGQAGSSIAGSPEPLIMTSSWNFNSSGQLTKD